MFWIHILVLMFLFLGPLAAHRRVHIDLDCNSLRKRGILTPKCAARYAVHERREPAIEDKPPIRRSPLPIAKLESEKMVVDSGCEQDGFDGNFLMRLFSNLYRQLVLCDRLEFAHVPLSPTDHQHNRVDSKKRLNTRKDSEVVSSDSSFLNELMNPIEVQPSQQTVEVIDESHGIRRAPPRRQKPKLKKRIERKETKRDRLNARYQYVETIKWHDPLQSFYATEQQKRNRQKFLLEPWKLRQSFAIESST